MKAAGSARRPVAVAGSIGPLGPSAKEAGLSEGEQASAYEEAARIFRELLELDPESAAAHEGIGYACYRQEKYEEAREHYEALVSVTADSYEGWYNLGLVCQKRSLGAGRYFRGR